mmetsp:Transcript_1327/g.3838  ORF Transcript_1327/g.3838 Transcript_1327/m.3838 type:complete len:115 (-) Transcript_1327:66-410(-)
MAACGSARGGCRAVIKAADGCQGLLLIGILQERKGPLPIFWALGHHLPIPRYMLCVRDCCPVAGKGMLLAAWVSELPTVSSVAKRRSRASQPEAELELERNPDGAREVPGGKVC